MRRPAALVLVALFLGLVACAPSATGTPGVAAATATIAAPSGTAARSPTSVASPSPDRVAGWRADLERLLPAMEAVHPDLYHDVPKAELVGLVDDLKGKLATATDDELMVGVTRIVARVSAKGRDSHTGLFPWNPSSTFTLHSLPLRLWVFPDGVHVIAALAPHTDLVGVRLDTIAGRPVAEVIRAIDPLIPRDNDATVRLLTPRFLLIPEVLHGLGLVDAVGPLELGVTDAAGVARTVTVDPIPMTDYNAWAGGYGLFLPADPKVLYLSRMDEPLWWTRLADGTLFVQYNRVEFLEPALLRDLVGAATAANVKRVVVDIRHNYGGEVRDLTPVVDALDEPKVDQPGRLFLITGRNTYSAACLFAAELQARTGVTIVGEPMGGSPNLWGDPDDISLAWSGLTVGVSTMFELATTADDVRLTIDPELAVPLTYADWAAGRDAALEKIRARP
jgi:hypothetical protein